MKIKKVEIKNFRNLSNLVIDVDNPTTIIGGKNDLGKSNALNAIMWVLTNTILTDKWGSGENDIDSIVPIKSFGSSEFTITKESDTSFRIDVNRHLNANEWTDFIFQVVVEGGSIRESGTSGTMTELKIRDVRPLN